MRAPHFGQSRQQGMICLMLAFVWHGQVQKSVGGVEDMAARREDARALWVYLSFCWYETRLETISELVSTTRAKLGRQPDDHQPTTTRESGASMNSECRCG